MPSLACCHAAAKSASLRLCAEPMRPRTLWEPTLRVGPRAAAERPSCGVQQMLDIGPQLPCTVRPWLPMLFFTPGQVRNLIRTGQHHVPLKSLQARVESI